MRRARDAMSYSETRRQLVHMAMGGFALLLRVLTWRQAAVCALAAFLFNLVVLPRLGGPSLYRPVDAARGYPLGILLYPLAVLLLILTFPHRLDIVAITWGILAYGDGAATLVGRWVRGPGLPWNPEKTVAGTAAFVIAGAAAGIVLAWWTRAAIVPQPPWLFVCVAPLAGAAVAGLVESMPVRLDDNLSVPVVAAAVIWGLSLVTHEAWHASAVHVWQTLPLAVIFNGVVAAIGWRAGTVSVAGAIGGAAIGAVVAACTGLAGWTLLFASFVAATASSRLGLKRKAVLGIAEEHGGRRGPGNAIANCGLAAAVAMLAVASPYREAALLAFVAALTAGASDTVASEIGKAWGRRTFLVPNFTPVRPGTPGAVSLEGTAAGLVAALALAALALALGLIRGNAMWFVVAGATAGSFVESGLGATLEAPGILNNDMLNFINTAVAALVALACAAALA
ncbi:MAG: DUF92 domain-containing protein [Acidobacteria bacterium]|nr:DUF92 domain-containing protein [Acidobacteriota bacterium]